VPQPAALKRLISDFVNRSPMRATSLIVTVFGDVVSQHGNTVWLGSLVKSLAPLGVNERLVRTSVFRLVKEGWLESERVGRRSFYRFTSYGTHEYERAARRIYALEHTDWPGRWQLLIPVDVPDQDREQFRRSLYWQGYRAIAPNTFAKPGEGGRTLRETLEEFDVDDKVIIINGDSSLLSSGELMRKVVHEHWRLNEVARDYQHFLECYKPLLQWTRRTASPAPEAAYLARTLLIHDYRRILLQDPPLPDELLPAAWPGARARELAGRIYKALAEPSIHYISTELESGNGQMPGVEPDFWNRFDRIQ